MALILALLVAGRVGRAETEQLAKQETLVCLAWAQAPHGCPTARQTETAVEDMLGYSVFGAQSCDLIVRGAMRQLEGGAWQADLSFTKGNGEALGDRKLRSQAPGCAALKDPVSLVIALMVEAKDSGATLEVPSPVPATDPGAAMAAGFVLSSGLLPSTGLGARVDVGWRFARWLPIQFDSTFWFPHSTILAGRGGEFWAWTAGAGVCPTVLASAYVAGTVCAGVEAGIIHGTGIGFPYVGSPTRPYGDVEVHARLSFPLWRPLAGFVQFGVAVPWVRPRFVYLDESDTSVEVYRPGAVVLFGGIGIEMLGDKGARQQP